MPSQDNSHPLVSVVIPTCRRSEAVSRALRSALAQTYAAIEVIVVIDGPDDATSRALGEIVDSRLKVVHLTRNQGGSVARNTGVARAKGEWIAFLDDDDEWLPEKLEKQMALAQGLECVTPIISCQFIAQTDSGAYIWPRRFPRAGEALSEYLLTRRGIGRDDGFVATPTILTPKSLLERVRFKAGLRKHQDWDWVLRATTESNVGVYFCQQPLVRCDMRTAASVSRSADWRTSLRWIEENRHLVTDRAYAAFLTTHIGWQAAAQRTWKMFFPLIWRAFMYGSIRLVDLVRYVGFWFVPSSCRNTLKRWGLHILGTGRTGLHSASFPIK
jgi:glycosyltransferase involved in cell wall biosynthesis